MSIKDIWKSLTYTQSEVEDCQRAFWDGDEGTFETSGRRKLNIADMGGRLKQEV